jgi:transcriptional regulator GlxA family with amidase domain
MRVPWGLEALAGADTVIVPGLADPTVSISEDVLRALRGAAEGGSRIASICVGAFTLSAAGLLDGLRATTHWAAAAELSLLYPEVEVDDGVLFVDNGQVLTSAGAAAGLDLCLHMIRRDHGSAVAADAARLAVMPLERDGGQAQFIVHEPPGQDGSSLEPLLRWIQENVHSDLTLHDIAARARLSTRTLNRRFREQTGTTPLRWLRRARIRRSQHLLETTTHPVERISRQVGFNSSTSFRGQFKTLVGTSPRAYRRAFQGSDRTAR